MDLIKGLFQNSQKFSSYDQYLKKAEGYNNQNIMTNSLNESTSLSTSMGNKYKSSNKFLHHFMIKMFQ